MSERWQINGSHVYTADPERRLLFQVLTGRGTKEFDRVLYLASSAPELLEALKDDLPPIPHIDAICHRGLCFQADCIHCQRIIRKHYAIDRAEGRS